MYVTSYLVNNVYTFKYLTMYTLYNNVKIPIIGIGGIMNWEDVVEFLLVGAAAVQLGTVNFVNPFAINEIPEKLVEYCYEKNVENIQKLTGGLKT